jgi:hypothetical protein
MSTERSTAPTSATAQPKSLNPGFGKFLGGLVLGLVVGMVAGAILPPMLGLGAASMGTGEAPMTPGTTPAKAAKPKLPVVAPAPGPTGSPQERDTQTKPAPGEQPRPADQPKPAEPGATPPPAAPSSPGR